MRRIAPLLAAAVVLLAACGQQPSAQTSPSPTPAPSARAGPFVAVLEGATADAWANTVALLDVQGHRVASATFTPLKKPVVPMAVVVTQSQAQVGTAGVYYVDGNGVVRLLRPSGQTSVVTTLPMTPEQHEVWYAVSPAGDRVLAGILALPAVQPAGQGMPPTQVGPYRFDLVSAPAGGQATVLKHVESPLPPEAEGANWHTTFPVGWTQSGPVAMVGAPIATQNIWYGGPLFTIGTSGDPAARVGGAECQSASILPSGTVPCITGSGTVTVRDAGGQVIWTPAGVEGFLARDLKLSPAGDAITNGGHAATTAGPVTLPDRLTAQGWLDSQTLFGRLQTGDGLSNLVSVGLSDLATVHDLGFPADFAGVVPAAG